MSSWLDSWRVLSARLAGHLRRRQLDSELEEELAAHLALAEDEYVRRGRTPEEAKRLARVDLGGLAQLQEASREAHGLPWLDAAWLEMRLAFRTLRRSWGLTLVGGFAMTVAIAIGGGAFNVIHAVMGATLPLDEGERVVALMAWGARQDRRQGVAPADLDRWRETLRLVEDVGGFRDRELPAKTGPALAGAPGHPVRVAEITASGFDLARVAPLVGRSIQRDDERPGAPAVVVIGHDAWRGRFFSDPRILERTLWLGDTEHQVVGVMPAGFAFPLDYSFWTPLKTSIGPAAAGDRVTGILSFGRLRDGVRLKAAQAELAAAGLTRGLYPASDEPPVPRMTSYPLAFVRAERGVALGIVLLLAGLLLLPPCANVAILVHARTVARQEEISLRYVLGASRGRIVAQLLAEVLALALGAAILAVAIIRLVGRYVQETLLAGNRLPFWIDFQGLPLPTLALTLALALLAAAIAGVGPALRATGDLAQAGLKSLGRGTGPRLGRTWTALVVAQIAFAVAVLPSAASMAWGALRPGILGRDFVAEDYLVAKVVPNAVDSGFARSRREFLRNLRSQPGIGPVALSRTAPGRESWGVVALLPLTSRASAPAAAPQDALPSRVALDSNAVNDTFFETYPIRGLAGRGFEAADFEAGEENRAVLVSRTLAVHLAAEAGAAGDLGRVLGRRLRYLNTAAGPSPENGPVFEIVGVVSDLPDNLDARILYHPLSADSSDEATLSVRLAGAKDGAAPRLWASAEPFSAALRLSDLRTLEDVYTENERDDNLSAYALAAATTSVLLLSAAGIHALMSFTIHRKRREIGIRSALGARPQRLLLDVSRQALVQVGLGALLGGSVAMALAYWIPVDELGGRSVPGLIPAAALLLMGVGLLAAIGPARRALRVEPTEALREG
ncbi:MAG: ABC transporter permease [Vicinamibacteria bacterium]|nr:ABC transporter permease [Vicinamibacteria bacterium]